MTHLHRCRFHASAKSIRVWKYFQESHDDYTAGVRRNKFMTLVIRHCTAAHPDTVLDAIACAEHEMEIRGGR